MAFKDAPVKFNDFVNIHRQLNGERWETELLYRLLYSNTALQLVGNQLRWDLLIAVCLGDSSGPYDSSSLTSLVVQIEAGLAVSVISNSIWTATIWSAMATFYSCRSSLSSAGIDHIFEDHICAIRVTRKCRQTYNVLSIEEESSLGSVFTKLSPFIYGTLKFVPFNNHNWELIAST
jgi:hypothetical protein